MGPRSCSATNHCCHPLTAVVCVLGPRSCSATTRSPTQRSGTRECAAVGVLLSAFRCASTVHCSLSFNTADCAVFSAFNSPVALLLRSQSQPQPRVVLLRPDSGRDAAPRQCDHGGRVAGHREPGQLWDLHQGHQVPGREPGLAIVADQGERACHCTAS